MAFERTDAQSYACGLIPRGLSNGDPSKSSAIAVSVARRKSTDESAQRMRRALHALRSAMIARLAHSRSFSSELVRALDAVSPLGTLGRGYALLRDAATGRVIRSVRDTEPGANVEALLRDGRLDLSVSARRITNES